MFVRGVQIELSNSTNNNNFLLGTGRVFEFKLMSEFRRRVGRVTDVRRTLFSIFLPHSEIFIFQEASC